MNIHQVKSYLKYWLDAVNKHSLHGPFIFDLYTKAIQKNTQQDFNRIEQLRLQLLKSNKLIKVIDFGSKQGSYHQKERKIADIAAKSLVKPRFGALYNNLVQYLNCKHVIELGTSLGIGSAYLAWNNQIEIDTFEGCTETASLAQFHFEYLELKNIQIHIGNIDKLLPDYLLTKKKIDFVLIDANHTYDASMRYFRWMLNKVHKHSILVIDDIHYDKEMESAWREICANEQVYCTVDLYSCGLVFFDPTLTKQHHTLDF